MIGKLNVISIVVTIVLTQGIVSCVAKPLKGEAQYNALMGKTYSYEKQVQIFEDALNGDQDAIDAMCYSDIKDNVSNGDGTSFCDPENLPTAKVESDEMLEN